MDQTRLPLQIKDDDNLECIQEFIFDENGDFKLHCEYFLNGKKINTKTVNNNGMWITTFEE